MLRDYWYLTTRDSAAWFVDTWKGVAGREVTVSMGRFELLLSLPL